MTEVARSSKVDWDAEMKRLRVHRVCSCHGVRLGAPAFCGEKVLGIEMPDYRGNPCTNCVRQFAIGYRCPHCARFWVK
jgi:hypothetical protein